MTETREILRRAKAAKEAMSTLRAEDIRSALLKMAEQIDLATAEILRANDADIAAAQGVIGQVMIDRLRLDGQRVHAMAEGIRQVASLPCPIGRVLDERVRPNGLKIKKIAVPIGVIAIIYESRPNVTSDASALALGSGNAVVLRSGKDAYRSASAIVDAIRRGLAGTAVPVDAVQLVEDTSRVGATELMEAVGYVDVLIPRGGAGLIRACVEHAKVPVLETGTGICHIYADSSCDIEKALRIIDNAKTSRPSVCNACEVLLVHEAIAEELLPRLKKILVGDRISEGKTPVELRLCQKSLSIIDGTLATDADYDTEHLDYILSVKTVSGIKEAIAHISAHTTHHSEAIITEDEEAAELFCSAIDSACVYVNASTRFTDGGEFGLGCEMGIATCKIHARGPMGLDELTTYKYKIIGNGQIR